MMTEACSCIGEDGVLDTQAENRDALDAYIDELLADTPKDRYRGQLIAALHKAQELYGYLPESVQLFVANRLGIHLAEVYGVISFYSYFTDVPSGEFKIHVCTGTACYVKGADKILGEFSRLLGVRPGETTEDRRFSLGGLRCVGACSLAPVVMVNDRVYGNVTTKLIPEILEQCE